MSEHDSANPAEKMTEEEREELRKRFAKETEEYFQNCKRTEYKEGWNEATWEKEMAEHPLFAQSLPSGEGTAGELPPLLEALRQIKYDDEDNSPEQRARSYKEDGNLAFKNKDFRLAIACYNEGIRQKTLNKELNAQLYLNRAAAHYHLNNFETSLGDCIQALALKQDYVKAMSRAANCCWNLRKLDECEEFCRQILSAEVESIAFREATEIVERVARERKLRERNKRKLEKDARQRRDNELKLAAAFEKAGIKFNEDVADGELLPRLQPRFSELRDFTVSLVDDTLVWPVALVYPELKETDFVQRWNETCSFKQMLTAMYGDEPTERTVLDDNSAVVYDPKNLRCWYKSSINQRPVSIRLQSTLRLVLSQKDIVVEDGVPSFWVTRKNSDAERKFLERQSV